MSGSGVEPEDFVVEIDPKNRRATVKAGGLGENVARSYEQRGYDVKRVWRKVR